MSTPNSKKKKKAPASGGTGRKKTGSGKKPSRTDSTRGSKQEDAPRGGTDSAQEKTFVQKYYPIFENLFLFFLGMGTYWEALRSYLEGEFRYRTGQAFIGFAFFMAGVTFLVGSVAFLILALFFGLQWLTGSNFGAALAIFLIALGAAALCFYLTVVRFAKVVEPRYQDDNEIDEWSDF